MNRPSPIRRGIAIAGIVLGGAAGSLAQVQPITHAQTSGAVSTLPAAQPTGAAGQAATSGTATGQSNSATAASASAAHHVEVDFADGRLAIQATNASLNEILRDVSQKTGMKITGGVADDRVFGSYGPSTPALVLDALLDGTGSNMLLVNDGKGGSELILTPRHGGVTPPNPNAGRQTNEAEENGEGGYVPPVRPYQPPLANGRGPRAFAPEASNPGAGADPSGGSKTPQEIYDQLQQTMQQQMHSGSGSAPPQ